MKRNLHTTLLVALAIAITALLAQPMFGGTQHQLIFTENSSTSLSVTFDGSSSGISVTPIAGMPDNWNISLPFDITAVLGQWLEPENSSFVNTVFTGLSHDNLLLVFSEDIPIPGFISADNGVGVPFGTDLSDNVAIQAVFNDKSDVPDTGSTLGLLIVSLLGLLGASQGRTLMDFAENILSSALLRPIHRSQINQKPRGTMKELLRTMLFTVALFAWSPLQTRADTIGFSISGGTAAPNGADVTFGYAFTLSSAVTVTNLGLFDAGNDGLNTSHAVTIWTSSGTQLVQATIPAGTSGTLADGFSYVSITPFTLAAGTYTIGGFYGPGSDDSISSLGNNSPTITPASGLSYVGSRSAIDIFTFPSGDPVGLPNSYFGPNFQFTTAGVPDGGTTVSLLGCALLGLAALRRKLGC